MEYVIESLRELRDIHQERLEEVKEMEKAIGWTLLSTEVLEKHKARIMEIEKAIMVLTLHEGALSFMRD